MERQLVDSTAMKSYGYDEDAKLLEIELLGGVYSVAGVPADVVQGLADADSKMRYFNQVIKNGGYAITKIG